MEPPPDTITPLKGNKNVSLDKLKITKKLRFFSLFYARDGGYKGCNPYIERHLAIFVNCFCLERTNQLSLFPDKDLVDLYPSYRTITSNEEPKLT